MRIFISGDCHGEMDIGKLSKPNWALGATLCKDDILIITGDFGLVWNHSGPTNQEKYWIKWLKYKPWTTFFVDGNHECFPRLNALPTTTIHNAKVGIVDDGIYHIKRGEILILDGKKFFCFGGADSIDKQHRIEGKSWWREEIPSVKEQNYGLNNLETHNNEVDYIIAHTAPRSIIDYFNAWRISQQTYPVISAISSGRLKLQDPTTAFLDYVVENVKFKEFYCGHFHEEWKFKNYNFLYIDIVEVK